MFHNSYISGPLLVSFDVTYKCTLRCLHCFNSSGEHAEQEELSDSEMLEVSRQLAALQPAVICLCGGEPLLRKDMIYQCSRLITDNTQGMTKINIVSNGELLTYEVAKKLKEAGIQLVQISIDGIDDLTHDWLRNKKGVFASAMRAIENLREVGLQIGVACTPTLKNLDQIDEIITMCENLGVKAFRMQPLMPLGRANKYLDEYIPEYEDYRKLARKLNYLKYVNAAQKKMDIEWGDPIDHIIRFREKLIDTNVVMGISAYGDITISPYIPVSIGNIRKHMLIEYWESGYMNAWSIPEINQYSENMVSCTKLLYGHQLDGESYQVKKIDLIDDHIFA